MRHILLGHEVYEAIKHLVPEGRTVRRVIIDIPVDGIVRVFFETLADSDSFVIDTTRLLEGQEPISIRKFQGKAAHDVTPLEAPG